MPIARAIPLAALDLPARPYNILMGAGITTINELMRRYWELADLRVVKQFRMSSVGLGFIPHYSRFGSTSSFPRVREALDRWRASTIQTSPAAPPEGVS